MSDIENAEGEKIAELEMDLDSSREDVMQYSVSIAGDKQSEFELPRYDVFLGWIEIFGIPPYNEWVLLDRFDSLKKQFSGHINGEEYHEELSITDEGVLGTRIDLRRESGDDWEEHTVRELEYERGSTSGGIAIFDIDHSEGNYSARLVRTLAQNAAEIRALREELDEEEEDYLNQIVEENGSPSIVVLKKSVVDGSAPPVYRKMFPFWNKDTFEESEVRSLEIGYMDQGDTGTEIDDLHGDWYKLFSLEDFDHNMLEIREGNWHSTSVEFEGDERNTKKHYEKHLFQYS